MADDPEGAALAYFERHLKPKSASSLRFAITAARFDHGARLRAKIKFVERLYLDQLMATHDAVEGLRAYAADVRSGAFPGPAESYHLSADVAETLGLYGSATA